jgi:hypothetical protein
MFTSTAPVFTRDDKAATNSLAAIEITKLDLNAVMWRDHRRQTAMHTAILISDFRKTGEFFCYAGDALRLARYTDLKVYDSVFAGKKVATVSFPLSQLSEVIPALFEAGINTLLMS